MKKLFKNENEPFYRQTNKGFRIVIKLDELGSPLIINKIFKIRTFKSLLNNWRDIFSLHLIRIIEQISLDCSNWIFNKKFDLLVMN